MSIDETLTLLTNIQSNLIAVAGEAMLDNTREIVQLNKDQLLDGQKSDQSQIGVYRPFTIESRSKKNLQTDYIDLRDTGAFQSRFEIRVNGNVYEITSTDSKNDMLVGNYGIEIFGLNPENKLIAWNEFMQPSVVRKLAQQYNLGVVTR